MTNRSKNKNGQKPVKMLDLSFEGQSADQQGSTSNASVAPVVKLRSRGVTSHSVAGGHNNRPHGGYRGTKGYPMSPYTFNKSAEFQSDLERTLRDNQMTSRPSSASPGWAITVSNEKNHSGESPLFVHNLLAASRVEQKFESGNWPKSSAHTRQRPLSANDVGRFYQPNRMHQYLTTTELKNASKSEIDVRLGKPTRTTLLRARQRCNSAPKNAYEERRELLKQTEQRMELRRSLTPSYSLHELIGLDLTSEDSLHSFLIGARYNRAHFLDAKSIITHGVYMPRGNPKGCFMVQRPRSYDTEPPPAPPDSPASLDSDCDSDVDPYSIRIDGPPTPPSTPGRDLPRSSYPGGDPLGTLQSDPPPLTSPGPPPARPSSPQVETPQQAWDKSPLTAKTPTDTKDGDITANGPPETASGPPTDRQRSPERVQSTEDGIHVKGQGVGVTSPQRSSRAASARHTSSNHSILPTITGTSISRMGKQRHASEEKLDTISVSVVTKPQEEPKIEENVGDNCTVGASIQRAKSAKPGARTKPDAVEIPGENEPPKPAVVMVDKSFNVPSIAGDETEDEHGDETEPKAAEDETVGILQAKGRRSKVRFVDQVDDDVVNNEANNEANNVTNNETNNEDNVEFFLTEGSGDVMTQTLDSNVTEVDGENTNGIEDEGHHKAVDPIDSKEAAQDRKDTAEQSASSDIQQLDETTKDAVAVGETKDEQLGVEASGTADEDHQESAKQDTIEDDAPNADDQGLEGDSKPTTSEQIQDSDLPKEPENAPNSEKVEEM